MKSTGRKMIVGLFVLMLACCCTKINVHADEMIKTITGFEAFDVNENALNLIIEYKPSLEEIKEMMPDTLGVYLDENEEVEYIEVDWFCVAEDYENCDNFYFQFSPVWDETQYMLSDEIELLTDAPYMAVFFQSEQSSISTFAVTNNSNEEKIFHFLTENAGYEVAAACGIMANLYCESAFIPINLENSYEKKLGFTDAGYTFAVDTGEYDNFVRDTAGYGLCQWTYWTRKQELLKHARSTNRSIGDLIMQLEFMQKEISGTSTDTYIRDLPNTDYGSYKAAYYYCEKYERPAQNEDEKSVYRGNLARNYYWPEYCGYTIDDTIRISGYNVPGTLVEGNNFSVTGTISSDMVLTNISAGIYDHNGKFAAGAVFNPNVKSYDLKAKASTINFSKLEPGVYTYKVTASNARKTQQLAYRKFIVLSSSATISNGIYMMESKGNQNLVIDVEGHYNTAGAKINLSYKENTQYQSFEITHVGAGYYTIKNCGSGKYLEVKNGTAANSTFLQQNDQSGGAAQKWQFLPSGDGYYWLVPQCATSFCLHLQNSGKTENANAQIYAPMMTEGQEIKLLKGEMHEIFQDINENDWFYDYVEYVYKNDLMTGTAAEGLFKPEGKVTRAQIVTTLYRLEGSPKVENYDACDVFSDVAEGQYYTDAICWAYNENIATGNPDSGKFNTTSSVTRQQLATFLFRYAESKGYDLSARGDISAMLNADQVKDYALEAVEWAVGEGLISGSRTTDSSGQTVYDLNPNGHATRAQLAAILQRFCENNE